MRLENRVFVVTGATGATGRAVSQKLANEGASLILVDRNQDRVDALVSELNTTADQTLNITADLLESAAPKRIAEMAMKKYGLMDGWIHLIGGWSGGKAVPEDDPSEMESMLNQHAWSTFHSAHAFVPLLTNNGWGRIIVVSSPFARHPAGKGVAYSMGKAAQEALILSLAQELQGSGVTANALLVKSISEKGTSPDEIANAISFLVSDAAGNINGARIPLYGIP